MEFFPKRLQHGFGPKLAIFRIYFFCQYSPTKCVLSYSRWKKRLSWLKKKTRSSENQKIKIFPKGLVRGLGPKLAIFPRYFFRQKRPG